MKRAIRQVCATDYTPTQQDEERIRNIRLGITSAFLARHNEETLAFVFFDYLQLFFQPMPDDNPVEFAVWQGSKCIYSTFRDLYYSVAYSLTPVNLKLPKRGICIFPDKEIWITIHHIKTKDLLNLEKERHSKKVYQRTSFQERIFPVSNDLMDKAYWLLLGTTPTLGVALSYIPELWKTLLNSLLRLQQNKYPEIDTLLKIEDLDYRKQVLPMLSPVRNILDEIFKDFRKPTLPDYKRDLENIFCVVRTVTFGNLRLGSFPYTAGLLFSKTQRENYKEWCKLEVPLGLRSRSVADSTFCSGNISFSRTPDDNVWDRVDPESAEEQKRRVLENQVYPQGAELCYIPIHVNGIPWLALFSFFPTQPLDTQDNDRWMHKYAFYRDITKQVVSRIRERAKEEYITLLTSLAFHPNIDWHMQPHQVATLVNQSWDIASRAWPFPHFSLVEKDSENQRYPSFDLRTSGIQKKLFIRAEQNPYFGIPQRVEWEITQPYKMADSLSRLMTPGIDSRMQERELAELRMEKSLEQIKYSNRELLIRIIRHGFGNWTVSAKITAEDASLLLERGKPKEKILPLIEDCSRDCSIGILATIGLQEYGIHESRLTPNNIKSIIIEQARFFDSINMSVEQSIQHTCLPGRIILVLSELISNAIRIQRNDSIGNQPLKLEIIAIEDGLQIALTNRCQQPSDWLAEGKIVSSESFPQGHGLSFSSRILAEINGKLSLSRHQNFVTAKIEILTGAGGSRV